MTEGVEEASVEETEELGRSALEEDVE